MITISKKLTTENLWFTTKMIHFIPTFLTWVATGDCKEQVWAKCLNSHYPPFVGAAWLPQMRQTHPNRTSVFLGCRIPYYYHHPPHTLNYMLINALVGPLECRLPGGSIHNITHLLASLASCSSCQKIYLFNLSATQEPIPIHNLATLPLLLPS